MTSGLLRVLLVDDEELGRDVLRIRIEDVPDVEIIGEACDGPEAVEKILALRPDLVFLDVQMPGMSGLEVLDAVSQEYLPAVVFVTAHDEFALPAFEHHALDYLLKPVAARRLTAALERARTHLARREVADVHARVAHLLDAREMSAAGGTGPSPDSGPEASGCMRRIVVRDGEDFRLVRVDDVDAFEAAGNYVRIALPDTTWLVRGTLTEYEDRLDPAFFVRIHRSTLVNIDRVDRISPQLHGDFVVTLKSGRSYRMSRTHRHKVLP